MNLRLNFYRLFFSSILAFVSLLDSSASIAQTLRGGQTTKGESSLDSAQDLFDKMQYDKVTTLIWKNIDKANRANLITLSKAHEKRNEAGEMIRAVNLILAKNESDFEAQTLLGNAYLLQKKPSLAMESYKRAVELNPKYEPAYSGLVTLYEKRDPPNYYELRILFQDMVQNIGSRPQYLLKLCEINTLDAIYEPAIEACKQAISKNPKAADGYVYLGKCYQATGQEALGLSTLKTVATKFPNSVMAQVSYAQVLESQKNFVEAAKYYQKATESNPNSAPAWLGLASASFELRKYDTSFVAFQKACKFDKKNAAAFRKAAALLKKYQESAWIKKFEAAADSCTF
jgi:tetratricopeptide (TPR) repeat protein